MVDNPTPFIVFPVLLMCPSILNVSFSLSDWSIGEEIVKSEQCQREGRENLDINRIFDVYSLLLSSSTSS